MSVKAILAGIIAREGGYADHPDDRGGPTMYGITQRVARENGWNGEMRELPRELAEQIYFRKYYLEPRFDAVAEVDERIAEELMDTGANMGPGTAAKMLQRCLNALNQQGKLFSDVPVDGKISPGTVLALNAYCAKRGAEGRLILLKALNCLQGARYVELAEARQQNETFLYGWLRERVGI